MRTLVRDGTHPAFATHDPPMVNACRAYADERGLTAEAFEFQMLYGVRRDLQAAGLPGADLPALRTGMVPVFHAPPG